MRICILLLLITMTGCMSVEEMETDQINRSKQSYLKAAQRGPNHGSNVWTHELYLYKMANEIADYHFKREENETAGIWRERALRHSNNSEYKFPYEKTPQ